MDVLYVEGFLAYGPHTIHGIKGCVWFDPPCWDISQLHSLDHPHVNTEGAGNAVVDVAQEGADRADRLILMLLGALRELALCSEVQIENASRQKKKWLLR